MVPVAWAMTVSPITPTVPSEMLPTKIGGADELKITRHRRCAGRKRDHGAGGGGSVERFLFDAALIGNDVSLGSEHRNVTRGRCAAGNRGGISQSFRHNAIGINLLDNAWSHQGRKQ